VGRKVRSYQCVVCNWQGVQEPLDVGDTILCPQCGVFLYPLTWLNTWGYAFFLIAATVAFVFLAALIRW
jgi:hypothetical protein